METEFEIEVTLDGQDCLVIAHVTHERFGSEMGEVDLWFEVFGSTADSYNDVPMESLSTSWFPTLEEAFWDESQARAEDADERRAERY